MCFAEANGETDGNYVKCTWKQRRHHVTCCRLTYLLTYLLTADISTYVLELFERICQLPKCFNCYVWYEYSPFSFDALNIVPCCRVPTSAWHSDSTQSCTQLARLLIKSRSISHHVAVGLKFKPYSVVHLTRSPSIFALRSISYRAASKPTRSSTWVSSHQPINSICMSHPPVIIIYIRCRVQ